MASYCHLKLIIHIVMYAWGKPYYERKKKKKKKTNRFPIPTVGGAPQILLLLFLHFCLL